MSVLKISFLFRSPKAGWEYKAANKRDLAEDLVAAMNRLLAPIKPIHSSKNSVQHHFYITSEADAEQNKAAVSAVLAKLIPDEELRRLIIVSVTEVAAEELQELRQTVDPAENEAFWAEAQKVTPAEKTKSTPSASALQEASEDILIVKESTEEATEEPAGEAEEDASLLARVHKIHDLQMTLLGRVRGQRHAVDEVVQGIFESELFAANNPKRKGPLATFLFTGPSGVGKTFLAELTGEVLGRPVKIIDMSEYSDNLANNKFNGEHGQPAEVTEFVRKNPRGVLVFDEVEKAHINAIYLFLQILDGARMMDHHVKREVSFKDNIIIMTTNAGAALYEDATVCDLSSVPRSVILDGLRKDINPQTREPFFPECITTRMANGRVILFNHLEPYALLQLVQDEVATQVALFEQSSGVKVKYDPLSLAALILYNGGGVSDARTLKGLARTIISRELQEMVMQLLPLGEARINSLKEITLTIDTQENEEVGSLFCNRERMRVVALTEQHPAAFAEAGDAVQTDFAVMADVEEFKRRVRGVTDYVLLDPLCGHTEGDRIPNDVEDLDSAGMQMFEYMREYMPEIPVYLLDTSGKVRSFDTLLGRGARGVVRLRDASDAEFKQTLKELEFGALINNATFRLGRSNKFLNFNCAQYVIDEECAVVAFEKLQLKSAPQAGDGSAIAKKGENGNLKFADVIGCKDAKEALADYRDMLEDPRKIAMKGKKMPKGVLLYGPPGTGKTMLAKAMANECNATFIPATAAGFFSPYVGQTEINIRELFKKARKYAPSIIFIDEVDAIGRMRTGGNNSVHNEDALNMFLSEMDGFVADEKRPVFVLAATNYELEGESGRVLDPAFVRRFDRKILIPLPDTEDRLALLKKSLERHGIHFGEDHEKILQNMAARTGGMNNADLEQVNANYARLLGDGTPDGAAYMESLDAYRFGEVNQMDPTYLRQTACHEAGHALVCRLCGVTPSFLTVVSRGSYGGFMESAGENKRGTYTYRELMDRVCRCLAGRVAEIEVYGEVEGVNTGASSDIHKARHFMKASLNDYAMGEKLYSRWTNEEIEQLMREEYARTQRMIRENRAVLDALTDLLVEKKSLDQIQLEAFFTAMNV